MTFRSPGIVTSLLTILLSSTLVAPLNAQTPTPPVLELLPTPAAEKMLGVETPPDPISSGNTFGPTPKRVKRINEMLTRLRELAKSQKEQAQTPPKLAPPRTEPITLPISQRPPEPKTVPNASTEVPVLKPDVVPEPKELIPPPNAALPKTAPPLPVTSTVDRLALANNLFAQGKIESAHPIYEELLAQPHDPSTFAWIQYQLACCYRNQGKIKEATKLYRIVGSSKDDSYWAGRAQWWLTHLAKTQKIKERQEQVEKQLAQLRKVINAPQE